MQWVIKEKLKLCLYISVLDTAMMIFLVFVLISQAFAAIIIITIDESFDILLINSPVLSLIIHVK